MTLPHVQWQAPSQHALLSQKDLLVQEVRLTRGVLADVHEAGSENTLTIMKEVRSVAKAEVVDTQTVDMSMRG